MVSTMDHSVFACMDAIGNGTIRSFIEMRMKSRKALNMNQITIEKIKITKKIKETHRESQTKRNNAKPKYFYNKITVHQNKLMYI